MSSLIVTVCKVDAIEKHPNADKLSIVTVKGWQSIVGIDQYKVGDLVVFIPPDCVIPIQLIEKYNLEYLRKNGRTGTVKLRGSVSQGLVLDAPDGAKNGDDVAGLLGITKYEVAEVPARGEARQASKRKINPLFDKYTDIENIKNYPDIFEEGEEVAITEKIHGCNARYAMLPIYIGKNQPLLERLSRMWKKYVLRQTHEFVYGSHNVQLYGDKKNFYGTDVWGRIAKKYDLGCLIVKDTIIYGEIYGRGIQDMEYGLDDIDFRVFDIKYKGRYLRRIPVVRYCIILGLKYVPTLYYGPYYNGVVEEYTSGNSMIYPGIREGCVITSLSDKEHPAIGRKILKSISVDYLTRKGGTEYK